MRGGSKPGERRGGRQKGTQNKATERREELFAASGLLPMEFLLSVMRDPGQPMRDRIDAAAKVANYVHPRLTGLGIILMGLRVTKVHEHAIAHVLC